MFSDRRIMRVSNMRQSGSILDNLHSFIFLVLRDLAPEEIPQ